MAVFSVPPLHRRTCLRQAGRRTLGFFEHLQTQENWSLNNQPQNYNHPGKVRLTRLESTRIVVASKKQDNF